MSNFSARGRRVALSALTCTALAAGGGTAIASSGQSGAGSGKLTWPSASLTMPGAGDFMGTAQVVFGVFKAVRAQAPTIAAPIISQAITAGTITQAEGSELTALLTGTPPASSGAGPGKAQWTLPSAGFFTVMRQVMQAVIAQLPTIAQGVLDSAVTAGTIKQAEATEIEQLLTKLASLAGSLGGAAAAGTQSSGAGAGKVDPFAAIEQLLSSHLVGSKGTAGSHTKHAKHKSHHRSARHSSH